jgi:glycine/D-amino acid oxidase-like deaminating enzyme
MPQAYDTIIVGAGITGASTAYHLKTMVQDRVLLMDRSRPASGGTGRSAAIVRQHYSTPLMARLAKASVGMFARMSEELGQSGGYERCGYYFLVPAELLEGARRNVEMQRGIGIDTRFLSESEIAKDLPWLNPEGVAAVIHEPDGGYADPVQTTEAYVKAFEALGGETGFRKPARALIREGEAIIGVLTDHSPLYGTTVVNAAGPWAGFLAESAGLEIPLRSVREQDTVWEGRAGRPLPSQSISNAVDAIYLRPAGGRRFIVGRGYPKDYFDVDPYNFKETEDEDFVSDVLVRLERRFPPLAGAKRVAGYAALYDVTPDWYPFIGPRRGLAGYFDACGGSGHGFKIGPAIGRELARWIAEGQVKEDFAGLSHDRIAAGKLFQQAYGGNRG